MASVSGMARGDENVYDKAHTSERRRRVPVVGDDGGDGVVVSDTDDDEISETLVDWIVAPWGAVR